MNAVTKLNNLKASDKSTGKKSYEIAGQIEEIEKLKKKLMMQDKFYLL